MHGTLDRYHRQIWTESRGNPAVPHVFEIMDYSIRLYIWGLFQVYTHIATCLSSQSPFFFLRIRKSGEITAGIGENVEESIQVWI